MLRKIQTLKKKDVKSEQLFLKLSKVTCLPCYSSSWFCSINLNKTRNLSLLSLWTVSAQQAPLLVPVRTILKQDQESLAAPGPDCLCHAEASSWSDGSVQTVTPNPGLMNPETFMEDSRSAGALVSPPPPSFSRCKFACVVTKGVNLSTRPWQSSFPTFKSWWHRIEPRKPRRKYFFLKLTLWS